MSQPSSESDEVPSVLTKTSPWNVYNVMLAIALAALLIATTLLILEWARYGFQIKGPTAMIEAFYNVVGNQPLLPLAD